MVALRVFDAAARRLSFSKAADELNVTQGAVSRQIKLLENYLTKPLFRRLTRRVELTPFGARFFGSTSSALDEIEQATNQAFGANKDLSVSILPTTATLWLLNHLSAFMQKYPHIHVRVSTSMDPVDFRREGFDAAIQVGKLPGKKYGHDQPQINFKMVEDWNGVVAIKLWDDLITPVCSKKLLSGGPPLKTLKDLQHYRLIHTTVRPDCWPAWLRAQKAEVIKGKDDIEFSHSFMAVQAVREHVGIAAVPTIEIDNLEWRDELVFPFKRRVRSAGDYYLLCSEEQSRRDDIRVFTKWLSSFN